MDMFDFGKANKAQRAAICTVDGPVLITAGPGTGKTFTLVQRTVYLILEKGVRPEQILIATFTEKAAKEIITRISNELLSRNIAVNINEMYIGTFHQICLRLIKEYIAYSTIRKNFRNVDDFEQKYLVFQNMGKFRTLPGFDRVVPQNSSTWNKAECICQFVNNLSEEMVDPSDLAADQDPFYAALGRVWMAYQQLSEEKNFLDFSGILTEAYRLISRNEKVLSEVRAKIKYLMIDEYQDTNYIQEQLVFQLAGDEQNICVVGDDDQGLYRFRGATIRNILEFPSKFAPGKCRTVQLTENYRSNEDIVAFYNNWIQTTSGTGFSFSWDHYRHQKTIVAANPRHISSPAVIKVSASYNKNAWRQSLLDFIRRLMDSGKLKDLNQIAFLFNSVKAKSVVELAAFLEENGIGVYSPRSSMFFERQEVKLMLGALILAFPQYDQKLRSRSFERMPKDKGTSELLDYYDSCLLETRRLLLSPEYSALYSFLKKCRENHSALKQNTDYGYSGLIYQLMGFEPFASILGIHMNSGVSDLRPARNLSKLTEVFTKYEYLQNISVLTPKSLESGTDFLFNVYLKVLYQTGIGEHEDDAEYAPSGCVSFLTVHQSKGMEFPVVIVGNLWCTPQNNRNDIIERITEKFCKRTPYEPEKTKPFFDFWRLYYTAFSRAQDLLVLTANESSTDPSIFFKALYKTLPAHTSDAFDIGVFSFQEVKSVNLKETLSFTSHISVYEQCPLQYKFFKELGFSPVRISATLFGQIVHQTIEDIHKAALRGETASITKYNIRQWLWANYTTLSKNEHAYLGKTQIEAAVQQVFRYVDRQRGDWSRIQEAEVEVSLLTPDYILKGQVDLIRGKGDTVELVDFKSEKKPDEQNERLAHYKKQLQVYAYLVEQKTGHKVTGLHLYYTGDESGNPHVSFPVTQTDIAATISEFDSIAKKILNKEFTEKTCNKTVCSNCDFRFYCKKGN